MLFAIAEHQMLAKTLMLDMLIFTFLFDCGGCLAKICQPNLQIARRAFGVHALSADHGVTVNVLVAVPIWLSPILEVSVTV
jgi:hypothetical protein